MRESAKTSGKLIWFAGLAWVPVKLVPVLDFVMQGTRDSKP